jgi:hypothetical protein
MRYLAFSSTTERYLITIIKALHRDQDPCSERCSFGDTMTADFQRDRGCQDPLRPFCLAIEDPANPSTH